MRTACVTQCCRRPSTTTACPPSTAAVQIVQFLFQVGSIHYLPLLRTSQQPDRVALSWSVYSTTRSRSRRPSYRDLLRHCQQRVTSRPAGYPARRIDQAREAARRHRVTERAGSFRKLTAEDGRHPRSMQWANQHESPLSTGAPAVSSSWSSNAGVEDSAKWSFSQPYTTAREYPTAYCTSQHFSDDELAACQRCVVCMA
ncbi:hypothetical protein EXIGLDRAFT_283387 [Exidia glandulosa HHB12029]|uniref:Uncharacterized protein n=1 Tax=Exidia glandulosa HHB12029 TaxID=1314781 RepID=A0A165ZP61_EXIGL|nr:hypothetical protein EXIGLDRAFT_283387 [Exidia glandulosa HHB12029]